METKNNNQNSINLNWLWGSLLIALGAAFLLGQFVEGFSGLIVAAFFVGGGAIFFTIYARNHEHWWALIPGYALLMIGTIIVFATAGFPGELIGAFVMFAIALPFFYVYVKNRENWWALIPAYIMASIGTLVAFGDIFPDFLIAPFVLISIALPFLYVYLRNRENWWALIPAYVMLVIAFPLSLEIIFPGVLVAPYVMFAIALPFLYVYLRNREYWWALIPAGVTSLIGVGLLMTEVKYVVPAVLIVIGVYLLGRQVIHDKPEDAPLSGPDADRPPSV
jgi:hypothetical protein